jgi:hypothetical protein
MANMTEAQFKALQDRAKPTPRIAPPKRGMNKWERAYAEHLNILIAAKEVRSWRFEAIRLRLADGAWFKPDFLVQPRHVHAPGHSRLEFHEVKGFWREAARVRIKVAAELYPEFVFIAVTRKGGEWVRERFYSRDDSA